MSVKDPYAMFDDSDVKDSKEDQRAKELEDILALPDINLEQVAKLMKAGHEDKFIAEFFGISTPKFVAMKRKYPIFADLCDDWRRFASARVERALYERAVGYEHPEEKVFCDKGEIITHEQVKHYPPDVGAAKYWLNNRKPKEWKEKQEIELNANDNMADMILKARERLRRAKKDPQLSKDEEEIFG